MPVRVLLEPLDGHSEQHAQRLHDMVGEMGWSQSATAGVLEAHREGKRAVYWIVIDPNDPSYGNEMEKAGASSDIYKEPLVRSKTNPLASSSSSEMTEFIPIGNIGLNMTPLDPAPKDAVTIGKTITMAGFYVTRALQGSGIGTGALEALAQVARAPPLSAKALVLYVLSKETEDQDGLYRSINRPPQVSKQDFYAKRGFELYDLVFTPEYVLEGGHTWPIKWAYMRRLLISEKCDRG